MKPHGYKKHDSAYVLITLKDNYYYILKYDANNGRGINSYASFKSPLLPGLSRRKDGQF